jgi:small multidrug resistance pump
MNAYLALSAAIVLEVISTAMLKASDSFTKLWPTLGALLGFAAAFYCLTLVLRTVPTGVAYAIWSGVGIVLTAGVSWVVFKQRLDAPALGGMALIVAGVVVMNVFSKSTAH